MQGQMMLVRSEIAFGIAQVVHSIQQVCFATSIGSCNSCNRGIE